MTPKDATEETLAAEPVAWEVKRPKSQTDN